ncbi:MAG: minC [Moraxellaceae bacterium]|jgi:septum site-determining protein MinC|nr:minC [Moraxellaceae bacterium]
MKQYELPVSPTVFRLKGSTLAATVLELSAVQPEALARQLAQKVEQAPQLLRHSPLIITLDKLAEADGPLDLADLLATCRRLDLQPVAVRALRADDISQAARLGLACLPALRGRERALQSVEADAGEAAANTPAAAARDTCDITSGDAREGTASMTADAAMSTGRAATVPETATVPARVTRVITQPVRGGQQIHVAGDLILLAPVSAGAEVMADGHIHVYAPLRGRALAGVQGDTGARIFCRELNAELVAIAGHYRVADDLKADALWGHSAQLFLHDDALRLVAL